MPELTPATTFFLQRLHCAPLLLIMFKSHSEHNHFDSDCQFKVDVELAPFPSLPRPKSHENKDIAPFNSDIDVTDFLTSQPHEHNDNHIVELAAIARKSSLLATCSYAALVRHEACDIRNGCDEPSRPGSTAQENSSGETQQERRRLNHRSRRGCWTCRLRHKACPEDGSPCSSCYRLNLRCDTGGSRPVYMQNRYLAAERLREIRLVTDKLRGRYIRQGRRKDSLKWARTVGYRSL